MKRLLLSTLLTCVVAVPAQAAWLGSALDSQPKDRFEGALVRSVDAAGPAARAGLRPGDVIVAVQMRPVRNARELERIVRAAPAGTRLSFALSRDGVPVEVNAVLAAAPTQRPLASVAATAHPAAATGALDRPAHASWSGVYVETLAPPAATGR